jgi:2-polyprenyl-3-methyl-5-hydroxy-6-metoxy-1,4-benzoquinol methylase
MKDKPLVVIGILCYETVPPEILEDWMRFAYHCGRRLPQYNFILGIKTKTEQFRARNALVTSAQQVNADYLLMLDDDMVINPFAASGLVEGKISPVDDYDLVDRLIKHDKDICGVLYYQKESNCSPVLMTEIEGGFRFLRDDEVTHGLQRVSVAGGGCLMIKMRVFDHITFPFFAPEHEQGTDIQLCSQAAKKGMEVWADTSIELGHLRSKRTVVTSQNRHQFQITDTVAGDVRKQFVSSDIYDRLLVDAKEWTGYTSLDRMMNVSFTFLNGREGGNLSDKDWYNEFPKERVARQVWYNSTPDKKEMTGFILSSIIDQNPLDILDFGCGIGIPALTLAERGHRVTAMDLAGTGTMRFLKHRAEKSGTPITFVESEGGSPDLGDRRFDVIVAMDSIEHIKDWKNTVGILGSHLKPNGVMFSNNAIMQGQDAHPEHYPIGNKEFVSECMDAGMMPVNQITFMKNPLETQESVNG